ncbi:MAG TPA: TetR family transcriptional regulator, partial [Acidimicrobiia bacterium]|nr:TetR family transcriptional regulator [Acidimicrobiia bacterium]
MSEPSSLRERKNQRTHRAIEAAALDLFEQRGFEGTTIDDIAAAAEIAPRTFFHYFP